MTKIADIINPQVIEDLAVEKLPENIAFLTSGAVDTDVDTGIEAGGTHLTMSYFAEDGEDMEAVTDEDADLTARSISETEELAVVIRKAELVSIFESAVIVGHRDPNMTLAQRFAGKAGKAIDNSLVSVAIGATPSANESDVAVDDTDALQLLDADVIIDGAGLLGDQQDEIAIMIMHSKVYLDLKSANLIDMVLPSDSTQPIPFYGGKRVIVSDRCPKDISNGAGYYEYTTFLVGKKAMVVDYQRKLNIKTDEDISTQVTQFLIRGDVHYIAHLKGMGFDSATSLPSEANLQDSTKWTQKAYDAKSIHIVKMITN